MLNRITVALFAALLALVAIAPPATADQSNTYSPTTGTVSGLALTNNYNNAFTAIQSCNSGSSAPANDISAAAVKGQCWLDTSTSPNVLKSYDGTSWVVLGSIDTSNHRWLPPIGGGTATVASATTTDLGGSANSYLTISGTTTITGFGSSAVTGTMKAITFSGALLLTHASPGLILPTAANITTVAGDTALAVATGSGNWTVVSYNRANGTALSSTASITAQNLANSSLGFSMPINLRLNASVSGNALTIALKGVDNADPSASNPVPVVFRDSTITGGDPVVVSIQAATSIVIPSTATLGATNGVAFRGWLVMYNSSGTAIMGVINCSDATHIYPLAEEGVVSPTNGAANSAGVHYSAASVTANSAYRIIGYFEYSAGLATAGTYNIAPTKVQIFGPGVRKPGEIVQTVYVYTASNTTTTSSTLTSTNVAATITPSSAPNLVRATVSGTFQFAGTNQRGTMQLVRTATNVGPNLLVGPYSGSAPSSPSAVVNSSISLLVLDLPGAASSTTYTVKINSSDNASTVGFPTTSGGNITLDEIMGALPEIIPDNDNDSRLLNKVV